VGERANGSQKPARDEKQDAAQHRGHEDEDRYQLDGSVKRAYQWAQERPQAMPGGNRCREVVGDTNESHREEEAPDQ